MSVLSPEREQSRARYPDEEGYVERDGVRVFYEVYGVRRRRSCSSRLPRSRIRGCGRGKSRTCRAHSPRGGVRRRAGTGSGTGRTTTQAYSYWEVMKGRAAPSSRRPVAETALLGGLCDGGGYALMLAADRSRGRARRSGDSALRPAVTRETIRELPPLCRATEAARHGRGLGQVEACATGGATSAGSSSSSSRGRSGSGTGRSRWRTACAGASRGRQSRSSRTKEGAAAPRAEEARELEQRVRCGVLVGARRPRTRKRRGRASAG